MVIKSLKNGTVMESYIDDMHQHTLIGILMLLNHLNTGKYIPAGVGRGKTRWTGMHSLVSKGQSCGRNTRGVSRDNNGKVSATPGY